MDREELLEQLESEFKKVDHIVNPILFSGVGLFLVYALLIDNGYIQEIISDVILIGLLVAFILSLIIYTAKKKSHIARNYGLTCPACHKTAKAGIALEAIEKGLCPYCSNSYRK